MSRLLDRWALHAGRESAIAVVDAQGEHTYAALDRRARAFAAALREEASAGERVALLVAPGADFVAAFFGVLLARGVVVVLSPLHPAKETAYFLEDAGVRTIVASPDLAARLDGVAGGRRVIRTDAPLPAPFARDLDVHDEDPALQLYTSGTTGKPKGAVIGHANLAQQQALLAEAWGVTADDVLLHALPLHHMHGLAIALLTCIGAGATTRMLGAFDAARVWEAMAGVTTFMAVPTMYQRMFVALDAADAATRARWAASAAKLRLATSGSAALPVTLAGRWRELTGDIPLERFGMTEIGVGMTNPLRGNRKPGFVGRPLPTVDTRVTADGELWIRGPSVFHGYHARPEATREAFDDGGWFRTGDTVAIDADGDFKILGRTSVDILKSGGYKLSALEIEEALRDHPAVAEVAVVGVPDEAWGDRVVACVVARAGQEAACTEDALRGFVREMLAPYKVPKQVEVMRELPRNAVGKVVKPELVRGLLERGG